MRVNMAGSGPNEREPDEEMAAVNIFVSLRREEFGLQIQHLVKRVAALAMKIIYSGFSITRTRYRVTLSPMSTAKQRR
jgi:hypothetical protein